MEIKGIIPAIPTPFSDSGELNIPALRRMLAFLLDAGVHGIFAVGNAGEFYALEEQEKRTVLRATLDAVAGRVPVYFGAGAATTAEAVRLARMAQAEGADAVSVITPFLIRPAEEELFGYYRAVCEAVRIPVLPYNNPSVTGVAISAKLMRRLAAIDNLAGVKDSCGDLAVTLEFLQIDKPGFAVLAGRDNLILASLVHGAAGAISSAASACPEPALAIYNARAAGDLAAAARAQHRFAQLRAMFALGTFPSVIKAALKIRGIDAGAPRAPVAALGEAKARELADYLTDVLELRCNPIL